MQPSATVRARVCSRRVGGSVVWRASTNVGVRSAPRPLHCRRAGCGDEFQAQVADLDQHAMQRGLIRSARRAGSRRWPGCSASGHQTTTTTAGQGGPGRGYGAAIVVCSSSRVKRHGDGDEQPGPQHRRHDEDRHAGWQLPAGGQRCRDVGQFPRHHLGQPFQPLLRQHAAQHGAERCRQPPRAHQRACPASASARGSTARAARSAACSRQTAAHRGHCPQQHALPINRARDQHGEADIADAVGGQLGQDERWPPDRFGEDPRGGPAPSRPRSPPG